METKINYNEKIYDWEGNIPKLSILCKYFDIEPIKCGYLNLEKNMQLSLYIDKFNIKLSRLQKKFYSELFWSFKDYLLLTEFKDYYHPIIVYCKYCGKTMIMDTRYLEKCSCLNKHSSQFLARYKNSLSLKRYLYTKTKNLELLTENTMFYSYGVNPNTKESFFRDVNTNEFFDEKLHTFIINHPEYRDMDNNLDFYNKKSLQTFLNKWYEDNLEVIKFKISLKDIDNPEINARIACNSGIDSENYLNDLYYLDLTYDDKATYIPDYYMKDTGNVLNDIVHTILKSSQLGLRSYNIKREDVFYHVYKTYDFDIFVKDLTVYIPSGVTAKAYSHEPKLKMPLRNKSDMNDFVLIKHKLCGHKYLIHKNDLNISHKLFPQDKLGNCCCPYCKNEEFYDSFFRKLPRVIDDFRIYNKEVSQIITRRKEITEKKKPLEKIVINVPISRSKCMVKKKSIAKRNDESIVDDKLYQHLLDEINCVSGNGLTSKEEYIRNLFLKNTLPKISEDSMLLDYNKLNEIYLSALGNKEYIEGLRYTNYISCDGNMSEAFKSLEEVYLHTVEIDPNEYLY